MKKDKSELLEKITACDICGTSMRDDILFKHNAEPVIEDGWCCEKCNDEIVVPRRFAQHYELTKELKWLN